MQNIETFTMQGCDITLHQMDYDPKMWGINHGSDYYYWIVEQKGKFWLCHHTFGDHRNEHKISSHASKKAAVEKYLNHSETHVE